MNKLIAEQNIAKQRNTSGFIAVLLAVVVLLSVARVFLANWLVESSETLRDLDKKIVEQTTTNRALSEEIREKESLSVIENIAKAQGYVQTGKLTFVTAEPNIANGESQIVVR